MVRENGSWLHGKRWSLLALMLAGVSGDCRWAAAAGDAAPVIWDQTAVLPAAEAHQAAAADARVVYAISSRVVAKYDRGSGKKLAVSQGPAQHLNSGFLWKSRLYCAHSNYPQVPEQSQVKILDPDSMRLTTLHDFGDFGGSLTWIVRHQDHWWGNFARYGEHNGQTFLVRFDDQWKELGRWTYPPKVIGQLGRYSLSGGLWLGRTLLVTDHDHPCVYRLRLPEQGRVLELIDQQVVPFTGQGIALDPLTGGLVGIHRAQKQVRFAAPRSVGAESPDRRARTLRILSYNIHHAQGVDGRLDVHRIAAIIRAAKPDLVALQEVDRRTLRSERVDQPAALARLTGMQVVFEKNIDFQGGEYGNAILSKLPILKHQNTLLPSYDAGEQRGLLVAEIQLGGGDKQTVRFLATHLDHRRDDRERLAGAAKINALIGNTPEAPAILAGDLNAVPSSAVLKRLQTSWSVLSNTPQPTVPVNNPRRQIDYVLVRPARLWKLVEMQVLDERLASDHRPILAVLQLLHQLATPPKAGGGSAATPRGTRGPRSDPNAASASNARR